MPLVTVVGGSGFLGRHVVARLARSGWRVRVGTRNPEGTGIVRLYGDVGQVEPVRADVRDEGSIRSALTGADAVINLVGILYENRGQRFRAIHADCAGRFARLSAELGVKRVVHVSAIGADEHSESVYASSKAEGERQVIDARTDAVIMRPSIMYGEEDQFFNRFAQMAQLSPVLPVVGADTQFQPVYVEDVAAALETALTKGDVSGAYELGGPRVYRFRDLMEIMLREIRRRRLIVPVPFPAARVLGSLLGLLPNPPLTSDQVILLASDNVVSKGAQTLGDLGIDATPLESVIGGYLVRFRPGGQYAATDKETDSRSR